MRSSHSSARPIIRLTVPADVAHATLVRACVRDAVVFRSDDHESSFLVAVTEIVINAIEASASAGAGQLERPDVVVELWGPPDARVEVHDAAGGVSRDTGKSGHLGAGVSIAAAFVTDLRIDTDSDGTHVRLGLGEAVA